MTKEQKEMLSRITSVPVGAGRRFLVSAGSEPCAGFDTRKEAQAYVDMMLEGKDRPKAPACTKVSWSIQDRG